MVFHGLAGAKGASSPGFVRSFRAFSMMFFFCVCVCVVLAPFVGEVHLVVISKV